MRLFLPHTLPGVEVSALGVPIARHIPEAVAARMRGVRVNCASCQQPIAAGVELRFMRGKPYHPSCATRATTALSRSSPAPRRPRVIARVSGTATSFDLAGCSIFGRDGQSTHERFAPDCFDASIRAGGQSLRVNHTPFGLRGSFMWIRNDGGELRFLFHLEDGSYERHVLQRILSGHISRCSVGYNPEQQRYIWRTLETTKARLIEISVVDGKRPAWFGTSVSAEAV